MEKKEFTEKVFYDTIMMQLLNERAEKLGLISSDLHDKVEKHIQSFYKRPMVEIGRGL